MDQVSGRPAVSTKSRRVRRTLSLVTGTALTAFGLRQRSPAGIGLALFGGVLTFSGARRAKRRLSEAQAVLNGSITIDRSPEDVYDFWNDPTNLPRVLRHVARVEERGDGTTHWTLRAKAPRIAWDSKIVEKVPGKRIAWQSLPGGDLDARGEVRFGAAPGGRGTEVSVSLRYGAPGAKIAAALARAFGDVLLRDDLRRLKALLECGEIPTTEGQPKGK
jgi:uncharacterized membrane protein